MFVDHKIYLKAYRVKRNFYEYLKTSTAISEIFMGEIFMGRSQKR